MDTAALNHLCSLPGIAHCAMTREDLRALLLETDGEILISGHIWRIRSRHLGAGIYRVQLWPAQPEDPK